MLRAASDSGGEGVRMGDPGRVTSAPVRLVMGCEAVDPGRTLDRVTLSGILQAAQSALVHLLSDPAFVADVRVPAALVERGEYALHLGRGFARHCQPRTLG